MKLMEQVVRPVHAASGSTLCRAGSWLRPLPGTFGGRASTEICPLLPVIIGDIVGVYNGNIMGSR